ncbi:MAG: glucose/sorbosone dehydrogenase [Candidatus Adlerbacteria bacterium]|nr:glucose/sorbosone dehydrogenase [Candidatus Adlerbacteria bacterium]
MQNKYGWALAVLLVLLVGGYFGYQYVKYRPPAFLIALFTAAKPPAPLPEGLAAPLMVPEGFSATIFARDVKGARVLVRDPKGALLVSQTSEGKVSALPDLNGDGQADRIVEVLSGLDQPHGLAFICVQEDSCTLYVAETGALKAYAYDADTYKATYQKTLATFPTGSGHYTRTLLPAPDNKSLFVSVGSSCNACEESSPLRASVQSVNLETGVMTPVATGLRNTVFMALHPVTGELWGTENGRDLIGDDIPPDELNIIKQGGNYGWPICYGQKVHDTDYDKRQYIRDPCADTVAAHVDLPAHSAALGLAFVPEEGWPEEYWHDALVAYHGSWNRSEPAGYKVVRIDFLNPEGTLRQDQFTTDFVTGFLPAGGKSASDTIGRPVAVLAEPGGVAYVSDDRAGAVYKISLNEPPR